MYSINRLFFFSLGSVCFLLVPIFWLSLLFDFGALENFVVKLSTAEFVGYPIPELLGSPKEETVVDQVLRIKIFLTVLVVTYSLLFIGLSFLEGGGRRIRFCARGIAIPLFLLTLVFWIKFITDDHIISKIEKSELFEYTIVCLAVSVLLFVYSFHSRKKVKRSRLPNFDETGEAKFSVPRKSTSSSEPHSAESSSSEEGNLTATATAEESSDELPPPADPGVSTPGDMGVESEPVGELPPPLPEEEAVDPVGELPPPLPEEEAVDPVRSGNCLRHCPRKKRSSRSGNCLRRCPRKKRSSRSGNCLRHCPKKKWSSRSGNCLRHCPRKKRSSRSGNCLRRCPRKKRAGDPVAEEEAVDPVRRCPRKKRSIRSRNCAIARRRSGRAGRGIASAVARGRTNRKKIHLATTFFLTTARIVWSKYCGVLSVSLGKEDPPNHQSGDSSLEADDKKIEELKPPPF